MRMKRAHPATSSVQRRGPAASAVPAARPRRTRRATNLTVDQALADEARALGLNLSQLFEEHLEAVLKQHRAAAWLKENAAAFEAYNAFVDRTGIWNEDERDW